jgi:ABC-type proline/glycine betaine transport system substrate-binding protein
MRIALAAIAAGIAVLAAGASRLEATAGTDECPSLSTVSVYSLGWPEIRGTTNRGQLWMTGGLGPSAISGRRFLTGWCLSRSRSSGSGE